MEINKLQEHFHFSKFLIDNVTTLIISDLTLKIIIMDQKVELLNKFNNAEFGDLRVFLANNEPYFVGRDVASIPGYATPPNAIVLRVDEGVP